MKSEKTIVLPTPITDSRLTPIKFHHRDKRYRKYFVCQCSCGKTIICHGASIVSGNTKSCGCLAKESRANSRLPNNKGVITQIILGIKRARKIEIYHMI
jgi:hypothetical protein